MRSGNSLKNKFLTGGMKAAVFVVLLVLIFSPVGNVLSTPIAQAAYCMALNPSGADYPANSASECKTGYYFANDKGEAVLDSNGKPQLGDTGTLCNSISSCILLPVYAFTVGFGSFVAYVGGYIFNAAAQITLNSAAYGLDFVTKGWTTARDIANMGFILILIYIAITIILSADTGHTMNTLAFVIFIALIINFSFFFTRVVIDGGNIVAAQFYNASLAKDQSGRTIMIPLTQTPDLTASIMKAVGVQEIIGTNSFSNFQNNTSIATEFITLLIIYIFMGAMYFILAAAFLSVGIKFIVRIAVLWLAIIASPLALISKASHRFEEYFDEWQHILITHAFYPAIFLFIFWLITQFAGSVNIQDVFQSFSTSSEKGIVQIAGMIVDISIRLGFIIVMLFLGMKAADHIGVMGAKAAHSITSKIPGFGGLSSYGRLGGNVFRNTGGLAAAKTSDALKASAWANRAGTFGGLIGYGLRKGVLEPVASKSLGGASSFRDREKYLKERKKDMGTNLDDIKNGEDVDKLEELGKQIKTLSDTERDLNSRGMHLAAGDQMQKLALERDHKRLASNIQKFSKRELETFKGAKIEQFLKHLTESQVKALEDSDKFRDQDKKKWRDEWNEKGSESPLQQSRKTLKELRKIHDDLTIHRVGGYNLNPATLAQIEKFTNMSLSPGRTLDGGAVAGILKEVNHALAAQNTLSRSGPPAGRIAAAQAAERLRELKDEVKKLSDNRKKVGMDIGNRENKGEFEIKEPEDN